MNPWQYAVRLAALRKKLYLSIFVLKTLVFCVYAQILGLVYQAFFNSLSSTHHVNNMTWEIIILLLALPLVRAVLVTTDFFLTITFRITIGSLVRKNLIKIILALPGTNALICSSGEAITYFRDDIDQIADFMVQLPFLFGYILFGIVALIIMLNINIIFTMAVFLPMALVLVIAQKSTKNIVKYRQVNRKITGQITKFINEMFSSVQAIKVATSETQVAEHFYKLNEERRKAAVKDELFTGLLDSIFLNIANLGTGLILLLASQSIRQGTFSIGNFALFAYYAGFITDLTNRIGIIIAMYKQAGVSFARITRLLQGGPLEHLVENNTLSDKEVLKINPLSSEAFSTLEELEVVNLTYVYSNTNVGIDSISFRVPRGKTIAITGRIGSGKTTLLKVLLGLLPMQQGKILWNRKVVSDPTSFFVPPRASYMGQIPLLFSGSIKENLLMGLDENPEEIRQAIHSAVLEKDVINLEKGIDTVIGRKGVKLSGGQIQRISASRMFIRDADIFLIDSLSNALDVETEKILWQRFFSQEVENVKPTCLIVTHSHTALRNADHIIVLKDGHVEAEGNLEALLRTCLEMQMIWNGHLQAIEK